MSRNSFLFALLALALAWPAVRHLREVPPPAPPAVRLSFAAPIGAEPGAGDEALDAAIGADGESIVFVATRQGVSQLWRRTLESDAAAALRGTEGARYPAIKATNAGVAFFADRKLRYVQLDGAGPVTDLADAPDPAGATWLPDGTLLFAGGSGPIRRMKDGVVTDATRLEDGDRAHTFPVASGVADEFVYTAARDNGRRVARLAAAGEERDLTPTSGHAQLLGDYLLHVRDGVLVAQRFDRDSGALVGRTIALATSAGVSAAGRSLFASSPRLLLTAPAAARPRELAWFSLDGARLAAAGDPADYWQVRLSPDDRFAALTLLDPLLRTLDVVIAPADGAGDAQRLTRALAADSDPVWSLDGTRVLFRSLQDGTPNLFTRLAHTRGAPEEPLLRSELNETPGDWRTTVLFAAAGGGTGSDVWRLDPPAGTRSRLVAEGFNETDPRFSPDGSWVAYVSDESGRPDIYAVPASGGEKIRVSTAGGTMPRWTRDGSALLFLRGTRIVRAEFARPAGRFLPARAILEVPGVRDFDAAHRSDRLVALVPTAGSTPAVVSGIVEWRSLLSELTDGRIGELRN
jgi:dipeptidyl aminopeptidase/acylaminoacyl peptidase